MQRLQSGLGCTLPATLVFDFPNAVVLAKYLADQWTSDESPQASCTQGSREIGKASRTVNDGPIDEGQTEGDLNQQLLDKLVRLESLIGED